MRFFNATTFTPFALQNAAWGNFDFVNADGIPSAEAFGTAVVRAGRTISAAGGIASAQAFGTPFIPGAVGTIFANGIASAQAFGSPQAILLKPLPSWKVVQLVNPITTATSVFFGSTGGPPATGDWFEYNAFSVDGFPVVVNPDGTYYISGSNPLDPSDSFQGRWYSVIDAAWTALATYTLVSSPFILGALTIPSREAFGTAALAVTAAPIRPAGMASVQAFGLATVVLAGAIRPAGIASTLAFGTPQVIAPNRIVPLSIQSQQAFGTPKIVSVIGAGVIPSAEVFGTITLTNFTDRLVPGAIATLESFGIPAIIVNRAIQALGIESEEEFGLALFFSPGVWQEEAPLTRQHWIEEPTQ